MMVHTLTKRTRRWVGCSLLILAAPSAPAQVYVWQDESGSQQFSDQPPQDKAYQRWEPPENPNSPLQLPEPRQRPGATEQNDTESRDKTSARSPDPQEQRCRGYEKALERIDRQLRAGYREPRGNRLRARRRQLLADRFRECH